jgi:hypothetical protein
VHGQKELKGFRKCASSALQRIAACAAAKELCKQGTKELICRFKLEAIAAVGQR